MATSRNDIGNKFQNGDIPSQDDFVQIIDSFVHRNEDKADFQMVETGTDNEHYITPALLKIAFQNAGIISGNCYIPFKEFKDNFSESYISLANIPIQDSVKVYKNGQLLAENEDYIVNADLGRIDFSSPINNRNIEINYWSKNDTESNDTDPLLGSLSLPYKENLEAETFIGDTVILNELPIKQSARVYKNGQLLREGYDYTIDYNTQVITFSAVISDRNIEIDYWYKSSVSLSDLDLNTKYVDLTTNQTIAGKKTYTEDTESKSFIKTGGTANQFLMADGSVSATAGSDYDAGHSPYTMSLISGFQKLSNGLILQWSALPYGSSNYNFPIAWPNKACSVVVSTVRDSSGSRGSNHVANITQNKFYAVIDGSTGYMFAIGY